MGHGWPGEFSQRSCQLWSRGMGTVGRLFEEGGVSVGRKEMHQHQPFTGVAGTDG